eukprot:TRINITY_DN108253_c0_g1_i1.p1 TRINITY_DN108253_c0_g1~~TRINITY_DN108253_c0_g1_i1.p1  ORF type:complete len:695 (-),score=236.07 TRINITY_DN108253_c0_g1_i1:189-2273(-)
MKIACLAFLSFLVRLEAGSHGADAEFEATPVGKVLELLKHMKQTGEEEKQAEVVQWTRYKQFCDSTIAEKKRVIMDATQELEILSFEIFKLVSDITGLSDDIPLLQADIDKWTADKKEATENRQREKETYTETHAEYTKAIANVGKAHQTVKDQNGNRAQASSFLQLNSSLGDEPTSLLSEASLLNFDARARIEAFIAETNAGKLTSDSTNEDRLFDTPGEANGYEGHSSTVVDLLEKLLDKFKKERNDLEKGELEKKHSYDTLVQGWNSQIEVAEKTKEDKTAEKLKKEQTKAEKNTELDRKTKLQADDVAYRTNLIQTCEQKEKEFGERQTLRGEELSAIDKAVKVIEEQVLGVAKKHGKALVQTSAVQAGTSLASVRRSDIRGVVKEKAIELLRSRGESLHSQMLSALAIRAEGDGLGKVRKLISDLISRLQDEALADAEKEGWCKKELAANEKTRKTNAETVERLTSETHQLEVDIKSLTKDVAELSEEIAKLNEDRANATELRQSEKEENEESIKDAKDAQAAVAQAIAALDKFYGRSDKTSLLQQDGEAEPEAPEIFDSNPYAGMDNGGVSALLEVLQGNFARLEAETEAAEARSLGEHQQFMADSGVDKAAKEKEEELKTSSKNTKSNTLVEKKLDLENAEKSLAASKEYYEELKPGCLHPGLTRAEKIEKRKLEIESLKDVLEILE